MPPTGGVTPRRCDTPRTQFRKDICQKRLSYFKSISQSDINSKCSNPDTPIESSSDRTSPGSNNKNCRKKQNDSYSNVRTGRGVAYQSTCDSGKRCQQSTNRHTSNSLASRQSEVRVNGGSKAGFSLSTDIRNDCTSSHSKFQDDAWVTHAKRSDDESQRFHKRGPLLDSDEVYLGLSTHRPSSSPLQQPTESMARLTLDDSRNSRCHEGSTDSSATPSYDRFDPANLENVLGAERYERLLNNFNESRETLPLWTDVQKSSQHIPDRHTETVHNSLHHMSDGCSETGTTWRRNGDGRAVNGIDRCQEFSNDYEDDIAWFGRSLQIGQSTEKPEDVSSDEDLGLMTHRVDGRNSSRNSQLGGDECSISGTCTKMQPKEGIRCSFSVNQIYAQADKLNNNYGVSKTSLKPVHKVDYRHRVGTSLNVFESCFREVNPAHDPLRWEGGKSQDPWQDRGYVEVNNVYETEDCAEKKPVKSSNTARKCIAMTEQSPEMSEPDWKKMLPHKSMKEVTQHPGKRTFQPSDHRLGHLQPVDADSEVSSLQRYFSSLESLDKGSSQCLGFEPIPEPQIKDSPRRIIVKKKHVSGREGKRMEQKTMDSGISVRSSLQRKGKKNCKVANKGKIARSSEKLTQQVSIESEDWDISDATSKSLVWSVQSSEAVSTFDRVRPQKHWASTGVKSRNKGEESRNKGEESRNKREESRNKWEESRNKGEESINSGEASRNKGEESINKGEEAMNNVDESRNKGEESRKKVTGRTMHNADVGASRATEDCFTDVSSLVASEDSSLQDWVTSRTKMRSSNEDSAPSEHVKASSETVDHLQANVPDSRSIPVQHYELTTELKNAPENCGFDETNRSDIKMNDDQARYGNAWQDTFKCVDMLVRMCPECRTQNGEFETWCRQCRHILAHVFPIPAPVKSGRAAGESCLSTDANHRGGDRRTLAYCSMFTEDDESYTGTHHDDMERDHLDGASNDLELQYRDDKRRTLPNCSRYEEDDESNTAKHRVGISRDHQEGVSEDVQLHYRDDKSRALPNCSKYMDDGESNVRKHHAGIERDHQNGASKDLPLYYRDDDRCPLPNHRRHMEDDESYIREHRGGMRRDHHDGIFDDLNRHHSVSKHQEDVHKKELMANVNSDSAEDMEEFESLSYGLDGSNENEDNVVSREQDGLASMNNDRHVYTPNEGHQPDIPLHLRISLDSSVDSHRLDTSGHQGAAWRKAARISEVGQFEYSDVGPAGVDLPDEIKQELALDLMRASGDSVVTGAAVKSGYAHKDPGSVAITVWSVDLVSNERGCDVLQCNVGASCNSKNPSGDHVYVDHTLQEDQNEMHSGKKSSFSPGSDNQDEESLGESNDDDDVAILDNEYRSFISRLIEDPQLNATTTKGVTIPQPKKSKGRPKTASHARPEKHRSSVSQKSLSKPSFKQKWASSRSSNSASFSYDDFARCSAPSGSSKKRPSSAKMFTTRGLSVSKSRGEENGDRSLRHSQIASARASGREKSKSTGNKARSVFKSCPSTTLQLVTECDSHSKSDMLTVHAAPVVKGCPSKSLFAAIDPYALYIAMSPRIEAGDMSVWLCLPDEILLFILSFLTLSDLAKCARTCRQFRRVAADSSLWRNICLKKRHDIYDDWLVEIGKKKPRHLILDHCHGDHVTSNGLRELFRDCADSLQELSFAGCSRGQLTGDNILLHAASRCRNITHLDASWCNINDNGVLAISDTTHQLHSLCLNGCQALSDDAVHQVVVKHGIYLRRLELFGCFNITSRSMASMTNNCKGLETLSIGQCWKVTDISISQLSASLGMVQHLDIRGCKQIRDLCIHHIMKNCPHLVTFSVANCPNITDGTLAEIATYATQIRSLDVCGCQNITDVGVKAVAICCQQLEVLDISSTKATHRSVSVLATSCTGHLQVLKINFCKNITSACLIRLVRSCRRLTKLFLYGLNGLRNWDELRIANPQLSIEM